MTEVVDTPGSDLVPVGESVVKCVCPTLMMTGKDGCTTERSEFHEEAEFYYCYALYSHGSHLGNETLMECIFESVEVVCKLSTVCGDKSMGRLTGRKTNPRVCSYDGDYVHKPPADSSCLRADCKINTMNGGGIHLNSPRVYFFP